MIVMPILPTEICPYTGSDKTSYKHQVSRIADVVKSVYIICHFITSPFTYDYRDKEVASYLTWCINYTMVAARKIKPKR